MNALQSGRLAILSAILIAVGCAGEPESLPRVEGADEAGNSAPTEATRAANARAAEELPLADRQDFDLAMRGRLLAEPELEVAGPSGDSIIWRSRAYAFVEGDPPPSVHPSLWRQAKLNAIHGLFEVVPGIYQVRGYDLSNMSLVEGATGWIVIDPLTNAETARAAFALVERQFGKRPIAAVIFTHSHIDHFGGVHGILPAVQAGGVRVVAPQHFLEEATSENVLAGIAMARRSGFMYGRALPIGPRGHVDSGLGKAPAYGSIGILRPTDIVERTPQPMEIDGVRFVFQYAPHTEAPSELTFYLPDHKALCGAEVVSRTMHNLYTLRGAKVRDALRWSNAIDEAMRLFEGSEVLFNSHHWPVWGRGEVQHFLGLQRDLYKFLHDQTLRLANAGLGPRDIAERLELPEELRASFANRGYYGTVRHNAKAVYQAYFGWYDANPANLDPLPQSVAAPKYIALMGGAAAVLAQARASFAAAEYRWTATLLDHLVQAEPSNGEARSLLARAYDQLGYQAESGPWRDAYLSGAYELRHGIHATPIDLANSVGLLRQMPVQRFFDSMAVRLDAVAARDRRIVVNFVLTDLQESYVVTVERSVLRHASTTPDPDADVTVSLTHDFLLKMVVGSAGLREMIFSDEIDVAGSRLALLSFFRLLDKPEGDFPIVTPHD